MANKDKGKREAKKPAAKKQPKAIFARRREDMNQIAARIVREATEN